MATISISRDELMAKLTEAKERADREDAKALAKHEQQEQAALKKFRDLLITARAWDYKTLKSHDMRVEIPWESRPNCPLRSSRSIELAITQVKLDSRKGRFRLSDQSDWYKAATWLPESQRPKASVCD